MKLESVSPYSQGRHYDVPKLGRSSGAETETARDYEERTWRERAHVDGEGRLFIPPMAFKNCLAEIAKYLSVQIPGKGKATYTKHFLSGILVMENLALGIKPDDVASTPVYCNADGVRGSGKRVMRYFPTIHDWSGDVQFHVIDDVIKPDVFEKVGK
jgi:hypothetical protein